MIDVEKYYIHDEVSESGKIISWIRDKFKKKETITPINKYTSTQIANDYFKRRESEFYKHINQILKIGKAVVKKYNTSPQIKKRLKENILNRGYDRDWEKSLLSEISNTMFTCETYGEDYLVISRNSQDFNLAAYDIITEIGDDIASEMEKQLGLDDYYDWGQGDGDEGCLYV